MKGTKQATGGPGLPTETALFTRAQVECPVAAVAGDHRPTLLLPI